LKNDESSLDEEDLKENLDIYKHSDKAFKTESKKNDNNNNNSQNLSVKNNPTNPNKDKSELKDQEEEGEIEISISELNVRVEKVIKQLAEYMKTNKKSIKDLFGNSMFNHEIDEKNSYVGVTFEDFLSTLEALGILIDTIDQYCVFLRLNFNQEIETISVKKLMEELSVYGVLDTEIRNMKNTESTGSAKIDQNILNNNSNPYKRQVSAKQANIFEDISKKLKQLEINFEKFLLPISEKLEIESKNGVLIKKILKEHFIKFLNDKDIHIDDYNLESFDDILDNNYVLLNKVKERIKDFKDTISIKERDDEDDEEDELNKNIVKESNNLSNCSFDLNEVQDMDEFDDENFVKENKLHK